MSCFLMYEPKISIVNRCKVEHTSLPTSQSKKDPNNSPRAIIPMRGNSAGDPNELSSNGTEWANVEDIQAMQAECEGNATIVPAGGK